MVTLKSFLGMIAAVPFIMACNQTGQVNATLFPASGSENVNPDTHLVLTFSDTPVLGDSGMIRVYDAVFVLIYCIRLWNKLCMCGICR